MIMNSITPSQSKEPTILVVDDDASLLEIHAELFRQSGFNVLIAHDGEEAWEFLQAGATPDVVFTGIRMPRMDGFEFVQHLRGVQKFQKIPVVMYSHQGIPEHEKMARDIGVNDYIVRGTTTPGEVLRRIRYLLGKGDHFTVALVLQKHDGRAFARFLNSQQGTNYVPDLSGEVMLEVSPQSEKGLFQVRLVR